MHADDALRELDKVDLALTKVVDYLTKKNESNAALHLSDTVLPSPLTINAINATQSVARLREHLLAQVT